MSLNIYAQSLSVKNNRLSCLNVEIWYISFITGRAQMPVNAIEMLPYNYYAIALAINFAFIDANALFNFG